MIPILWPLKLIFNVCDVINDIISLQAIENLCMLKTIASDFKFEQI